MKRTFKPIYGLAAVLAIGAAVVAADYALQGGFTQAEYQRVSPEADGNTVVDLAGLERGQVRFYRYLNPGNQEVKFFVGRDTNGVVQVAFDANEVSSCYKKKRGYRYQDGWMVCNVCDKAFRLEEVNENRGGCSPVALEHRVEGERLILADAQVLGGWRFFR